MKKKKELKAGGIDDLSESLKALEWRIAMIARNLRRMGRWEIARKIKSVPSGPGVMSDLELTIVVHQESYFIFSLNASIPGEPKSGTRTFVDAVEKHKILPEGLLVRDAELFAELKPLSEALDFQIEQASKLKTASQVFRDMDNEFFR